METSLFYAAKEKDTWFKSYYVVWKPVSLKTVIVVYSLFKSYYVVWKPFPLVEHSYGVHIV